MNNFPRPHRRSIPLLILIACWLVFTITMVAVTPEPEARGTSSCQR